MMKEKEAVEFVAKILDEHKATDIVVVDVSKITPFASHYILATCPNERALGTFADIIEEECAKKKIEIRVVDGKPSSGWVVVDLQDIVVHLFLDWARAEIKLDELVEMRNDTIRGHEA